MDVGWSDRAVFGLGEPWPQKPRPTFCCWYPELLGIAHIDQVQTMGRRGDTRSCPVPGNQYLMNPLRSLFSRTNGHEGTGNVPDHVVQKGIGLHVYYDKVLFPGYRNPLEKPDGRPGLAAGGPKGGEIMFPGKYLRRIMHALGIEGTKCPANLPSLNAGAHGVVINDVSVTPVRGRKPGMKIANAISGPMN